MAIVYLGLGSNLNDPVEQVRRAIDEISLHPQMTLKATSSLHQTAPVGPVAQSDFINAVVAIDTTLTPADLLSVLQAIEQTHQRTRVVRWGPRTLDIDILLYEDTGIDTPTLRIPHPEMTARAFVLIPLAEIAPQTLLIQGKTLGYWLSALPHQAQSSLAQQNQSVAILDN